MLFKREAHGKYSPWLIHITDEEGKRPSNFFRPNELADASLVQNVKMQYLPECAV